MGLFGSLFTPKPAPAAPTIAPAAAAVPPASAAAPLTLSRIETPSAAPLLAKAGLTAPASIGSATTMSSSAYLHALVQGERPVESVTLLAHALPDQHGVQWAAASCDALGDKLSAPDKAAAATCKQWLAQPTPANQALAAKAAAAAGHQGPGAWAAQAAAWSKAPAAPALPGATAPTSPLVAKAVAGSVMLAAVLSTQKGAAPAPALPALAVPKIPAPPTLAAPAAPAMPAAAAPVIPGPPKIPDAPNPALMKVYRPFIEKGIAIAAGK